MKLFTRLAIMFMISTVLPLMLMYMTFVGTTIIYAYLQAIGIVNSHDENCFKYKKGNQNG